MVVPAVVVPVVKVSVPVGVPPVLVTVAVMVRVVPTAPDAGAAARVVVDATLTGAAAATAVVANAGPIVAEIEPEAIALAETAPAIICRIAPAAQMLIDRGITIGTLLSRVVPNADRYVDEIGILVAGRGTPARTRSGSSTTGKLVSY